MKKYKLSEDKITMLLMQKSMNWKDLAVKLNRSYASVRSLFKNSYNQTDVIGNVAKALGVNPKDVIE